MEISEITLPVNEVRDCLSNLNPSKPTGADGIPARVLKECSQQIAPSLCALDLIALYVLGAFLLIGSQLMLLQILRKIFRSQLKIIDQFHYFQSLWNAAFVPGFIPMSRSQLHLYNTDSCVPVRALRNFSIGKSLDKNRQMFCTLKLPRLSSRLTMPLLLKS